MKILHFIYDHPKNPWVGGGGAIRVETIGRLLAQKGNQVRIISGRYPGCTPVAEENLRWDFVGTDSGYLKSTFSFARRAARLAQEQAGHFDVVIEDFAPWNPLYTYQLRKCPAIVQLQNYQGRGLFRKFWLLGLPFYYLERQYPRRFNHAIVINEALNRRFRVKGAVISMGIDEELLQMPSEEGDYIAFLGRLDLFQKGLDLLVEAVRGLDLPVKIAGDGPGRLSLQNAIAAAPNITWVGRVEGAKKLDHLRNARFLVVPSRFEGQNMVVLEAAALGKAVLVSAIAELRYAVESGFALSFRPDSAVDLRRQIRRLWEEQGLRRGLEAKGRSAVQRYTWPRLASRFEEFCQAVASTKEG